MRINKSGTTMVNMLLIIGIASATFYTAFGAYQGLDFIAPA